MSFPVRSGTRFGFGWYPGDLAACTVGSLGVAYLVTVLPAGNSLRLAVALPLVFFLPGYALTAALFPASARKGQGWSPVGGSDSETDRSRPGGIDTAERLGCALALSIAIVPAAVIALAPTVGLTTGSVAVALAGATAVLAQAGVLRRLRVPEGERYTVSARSAFRRLRGDEGAVATASALVLVAGVVAAALALGAGLIAPQPTPGFTELGLFTEDEDGDLVADGFPDAIEPDESVPFVVAVENHERDATNYTVVIEEQRLEGGTVENRTQLGETSFAVEDGERERTEWNVTPTVEEGTVRIAVLLYEGESPDSDAEPAEDVHFWLEIGEDELEPISDADGGNETSIAAAGGNETDTDGTDDEVGNGTETNETGTNGTDDESSESESNDSPATNGTTDDAGDEAGPDEDAGGEDGADDTDGANADGEEGENASEETGGDEGDNNGTDEEDSDTDGDEEADADDEDDANDEEDGDDTEGIFEEIFAGGDSEDGEDEDGDE